MSQIKINIAVAGATGFVGLDLVYLLSKHPNAKITNLCAQKNIGKNINFFDKRIKKSLPKISNINKVNWNKIDLLYLSLPNGEAQKVIKKTFKYDNLKFIDLSADFRLSNTKTYKQTYGINHKAKNLIDNSIYAISEFVKNKIKKYRIISNPGCYPTSVQLPLIPLIKKKIIKFNGITIDSKSGYSGAGKNFKNKFFHKNIYSSVFAYSTQEHRHMSELDQEFDKVSSTKIKYTFNPHLLPTFRGILSSIYLEIKATHDANKITKILKTFHKNNKFIKVLKTNSAIGSGNVMNTNYCEISVSQTRYKNKIVIFSALDNLVKGASGQAIQNMNLLYGFKETAGLK
jgi:N-acetyl-gamma-glutamyl-phosphate reductase|tara:strand:+ start:778 stop:1809 length:1032 start_codon:yes stop_codon:yes gene_type:complete